MESLSDQSRSKIIKANPIGKDLLDVFRTSFNSICYERFISYFPDPNALDQLCNEDLWTLALVLLASLQSLPVANLLLSKSGRGILRNDILRLISAIPSDDFIFDRIKPLLGAVLSDKPDDLIWSEVYCAVTESTPPHSSVQWLHNTNSFTNSSAYRQDVDKVLKSELGRLYVGLRRFHEAFFEGVVDLKAASEAVFKKCMEGNSPLYCEGWSGWPEDSNQDRVLSWFAKLSEQLSEFAEGYRPSPTRRRPLAQPDRPIQGATAERKLDIGFVNDPKAGKYTRCQWSQILVPGELKSNPSADTAPKAWLDLGRYARKVLAAQDTRRFVLGFTICGSLMRVWEFDRLGGIASERFDINEDGLQFVSTILGFLWMNEEELGFDPTIITADNQRFIEIERDGVTERLIIDGVIHRARPCIAGRATICWKAHRERDSQTPLVIKDSWQYPERDEEGKVLCEATDLDVVNVARYYHHETVCVRGQDDDIQSNVRKGLDITEAENYAVGAPWKGDNGSTAGVKRSSSQTGASTLPPSEIADINVLLNRVHRRVIVRDYGKPIYQASSRTILLAALEGCIEGYESLHKAGFLHRDISINNLMVNEDDNNPSWPSFLIDLDFGIKEEEVQAEASSAGDMIGTRAFMAIGILMGEPHSFMHDLESFFWVLFWICVHYDAPGKDVGKTEFDSWNYRCDTVLLASKFGTIFSESVFLKTAEESFTSYYQPLIPWVNRLRKEVFPGGKWWEATKENPELYRSMKKILRKARKDPKVADM